MAGFLSGKYEHQLDDRGRIRIPTKFKELLGKSPFVTLGSQKCLVMYSEENAQKIFAERFQNIDGISVDPELDTMRKMFSNGNFVEADKTGRIPIPPNLLEYCGFKKNLISVGMLNRVEIWSEESWEEYDKSFTLNDSLNKSNKG